MLLDKRHTLRDASLPQQEQPCRNVADYSFQEHNYVTPTEASSQMTLMHVKQEESYNDSSPLCDLKKEKAEPPVACGQILTEKPVFAQVTTCGTESEGPLINPECSTAEISLPQKDEDTHMALETPCLEMYSGLQGFLNQSPSLVISLAAIKDMDEESEVGLKISDVGTQAKLLPYDNYPLTDAEQQLKVESLEKEQLSSNISSCPVVPQIYQTEGETLVSEQTNVLLQQYTHVHGTDEQGAELTLTGSKVTHEKLKIGMAENVPRSHQVCHKRGRPPKRAKQLQSPNESPAKPKKTSSVISPLVPETLNIVLKVGEKRKVDSIESSSVECLSEKKKTFESPKKATEAQFCKVLSEPATLNTPPAESAQASSVQPKERHTSVPLQDAMLLVEAMNQSTVENTAPRQAKCAPHVQSLQNVEENPTEQRTPLYLTNEVAGKLLAAEPSTLTQSTVKTLSAAPQTTDATPPKEAQMHIAAVIPNKEHVLTPSITTSLLELPSSAPGIQTSVGSYPQHQPHSLMTVGAQSNTVQSKMFLMPGSVSSLTQKVAVLSPSHLCSVLSTALATQSASLSPGSTIRSLPLRAHSFISVPQKTVYVVSKSSTTLANQLSGTLPQQMLTVKISRPAPTVSGTHDSQPIMANQESAAGVAAATTTAAAATATATAAATAATTTAATATATAAATTTAAAATATATTTAAAATATTTAATATATTTAAAATATTTAAAATATTTAAAATATTTAAAAAATTTAAAATTTAAALAAETTNAHTETCLGLKTLVREPPVSVLPVVQLAVNQKCSAVVKLTRLPFPMSANDSILVSKFLSNGSLLSTDTCLSANTSMSEEPNVMQEKASASSDTCISLKELPNISYMQPSISSKESATVFEKSAVAISTTKPSGDEHALDLDEKVISSSNRSRSNEPTAEEKQQFLVVPLQLTSVTSQAISDTHLHLTKTQFLAHLAVSPVGEAQKKASADTDARASYAKTCSSGKKKLQKNSLGAQPQSYSKPPVQTRTETNLEPCRETENTIANGIGLENDSANDKNTIVEPDLVSSKETGIVEEVPSVIKTNKDSTPTNPVRSGQYNDVRSMRIVGEASLTPRKLKAFIESTPVGPRGSSSSRDGEGCKNKKSNSVSLKGSTSCKDGAGNLKKSLSPQTVSSNRPGASDKKSKSASVSPKRTCSTRDGASPRKTKSTSMSPNRSRSSREAASPKKTKSTSFSPRRKNAASPKVSTNKSVPDSHRRSTLTKVSPSIKQSEKDSNSFSSRRHSIVTHSVSTKISKSEASFPSARRSKLPTDSVGSNRAGESTPAKKPRLVQASTSPKKNVRVVAAKKLAKVLKAETVAKVRESVNQANGEAMKNIRTQAVWTPPRMPARKTSSAGGKSSSPLEAKKETRSPRSVVYPPTVFLPPIPVKAAPIVSPLQPLLVIGKHLLKNQCGACGRVLSSIAALESHVSLHTGNRPFSCSLCGKTFPDSKSFKRHVRVHRNGRIHVCEHCGKGFVYRFGLSRHVRMVHSRIRPFVCQICNKGFFAKRDVEAHIRIHTGEKPYHCNLCEKKFVSRVKLNVHFRWHNGEKRHWCPYCGKGFLDFNNLKWHKYIHTGEKPYSCPYCSKHFSQSGHVKKHVTNVHKIESD